MSEEMIVGHEPEDYRQLLLDRDGIGRLRVDPASGRARRLAIRRVLRRYGATLAEASDTCTRLTGPGVINGCARLRAAGCGLSR